MYSALKIILPLCLFLSYFSLGFTYDWQSDKWNHSSNNAFVLWYNDTHKGNTRNPYALTANERLDEVLSYTVQMDEMQGIKIDKNTKAINDIVKKNTELQKQVDRLSIYIVGLTICLLGAVCIIWLHK